MVTPGIEIAAISTVAIGCVLSIVCVTIPYWEKNDPDDTINDNIVRHQGLWIKCLSLPTGNWECDDFNKFFLALPTKLQAARGLSLTALIFSTLSCIIMMVGVSSHECNTVDDSLKGRIRLLGGSLSLVAGFCIIGAVSWYANDIRIDYEIQTISRMSGSIRNTDRTIFGEALFIGWGGGILLVIGGIMEVCTFCGGNGDTEVRESDYRLRELPTPRSEYV